MFDRIAQRSIREISMVRVRNIHANTYTLNVILDDISRLLISKGWYLLPLITSQNFEWFRLASLCIIRFYVMFFQKITAIIGWLAIVIQNFDWLACVFVFMWSILKKYIKSIILKRAIIQHLQNGCNPLIVTAKLSKTDIFTVQLQCLWWVNWSWRGW